ncbi:hypothetical protein Tco_1131866 [Tanacetum coccineum]|uniref:Uncharacterized protein n=1 Tax=Tanacetum coccineum TaxID=301880 RepID=A0ABQ5JC10_9ASTR
MRSWAAFRENIAATTHIGSVEIHHIKQRDGRVHRGFFTGEIQRRVCMDVIGAPDMYEDLWILHGITHPDLIKVFYTQITPKVNGRDVPGCESDAKMLFYKGEVSV